MSHSSIPELQRLRRGPRHPATAFWCTLITWTSTGIALLFVLGRLVYGALIIGESLPSGDGWRQAFVGLSIAFVVLGSVLLGLVHQERRKFELGLLSRG